MLLPAVRQKPHRLSLLTLGDLKTNRVQVVMRCRACRQVFRVPLRLLIQARGESFSLLGKHPQCPRIDCQGLCVILYRRSLGEPFRPFGEGSDDRRLTWVPPRR